MDHNRIANEMPREKLCRLVWNGLLKIIRLIKLRTRWAGHVARMGDKRVAYRVLMGDMK